MSRQVKDIFHKSKLSLTPGYFPSNQRIVLDSRLVDLLPPQCAHLIDLISQPGFLVDLIPLLRHLADLLPELGHLVDPVTVLCSSHCCSSPCPSSCSDGHPSLLIQGNPTGSLLRTHLGSAHFTSGPDHEAGSHWFPCHHRHHLSSMWRPREPINTEWEVSPLCSQPRHLVLKGGSGSANTCPRQSPCSLPCFFAALSPS